MTEEKPRYISYLLRLWQVKTGSGLVWRASLESSRTGRLQGFADLDALYAFLRRQTGSTASDSDGDQGGPASTDQGPDSPSTLKTRRAK